MAVTATFSYFLAEFNAGNSFRNTTEKWRSLNLETAANSFGKGYARCIDLWMNYILWTKSVYFSGIFIAYAPYQI